MGAASRTGKKSDDTLNAAMDIGSPAPVRVKPSPRMIAIFSKLRACSLQATNSCPEIGRFESLEDARLSHTITSLSGWLKGNGRRSTALIKLKMELLAPIPSARVRTATTVKPGLFASVRQPYRKSCKNPFIRLPPYSGSEFRVPGSGFRVQGSGFRVQGSGFRVCGSASGSCHGTRTRDRGRGTLNQEL